MKLNASQTSALEEVRSADQRLRVVKQNAKIEVERQIQEVIAAAELVRDAAVRRALDEGVPKTRIRSYGMSTTNPYALDGILQKTEGIKGMFVHTEDQHFRWVSKEEKQIAVRWMDYRSVAPHIQDREWSGNLRGVIEFTPTTRSQWSALTDDSDKVIDDPRPGFPQQTIPGLLREEIERGMAPLYPELLAWVEAHS